MRAMSTTPTNRPSEFVVVASRYGKTIQLPQSVEEFCPLGIEIMVVHLGNGQYYGLQRRPLRVIEIANIEFALLGWSSAFVCSHSIANT